MFIFEHLYWFPLRKPVHTFIGRGASCNVFAIDQGDEIWLIDAGTAVLRRFQRTLKYMQKDSLDPSKIKKIFITHAHADHINAAPLFQQQFKAELYLHMADTQQMAGGGEYFWNQEKKAAGDLRNEFFPVPDWVIFMGWNYAMGKTPSIPEFHTQNEGDIIKGKRYSIEVIHTPGHTLGHANYYIPEIKALFCGDLMDPFYDHKPPINFPTSDIDAFQASIEKVAKYDVEIFCPAHADKMYFGQAVFQEICLGTLQNIEYAKRRTIEFLKQPQGMRIKDFQGKFPKTIWQYQEQTAVPFAVIKSLQRQNRIRREGNRFYYVD